MNTPLPATRNLIARGHLIDSGLMSRYLDLVLDGGGTYQIITMEIGRTPADPSDLELQVSAPDAATLDRIVDNLMAHGCTPRQDDEARLAPSEKDATVPDDFYSTTNHPTEILTAGHWIPVGRQRMDACIVVEGGAARCVKLRDVRAGQRVVVGHDGIRVHPPSGRARMEFAFMENEVSSERAVARLVRALAQEMRALKARKGRMVIVCGPVVIHTGGVEPLSRLIRGGYVSAILSGNALGVHDVEQALFGTSLGVDLKTGRGVQEGHKNHMRAINAVNKAGSVARAVKDGVLTSGILYEAVRAGVPFCLAGSIRDDGPLPDVVNDMIAAQEEYSRLIEGAELCLMLSSMLHAIGTGNMLPSTCRTVCVDINPAVVTKLADRGTGQAMGVVTDVGLFLTLLAGELEA
jgi:lysine-ketoglutarate reductase/saccharopine dehydrogenase-like protein (TIGR00300 family)